MHRHGASDFSPIQKTSYLQVIPYLGELQQKKHPRWQSNLCQALGQAQTWHYLGHCAWQNNIQNVAMPLNLKPSIWLNPNYIYYHYANKLEFSGSYGL